MFRICDWATTGWTARQRAHRKSLAAALAAAALLQPAFTRAATVDWNVVDPENYDSTVAPDTGGTLNWKDTTQTNTTIVPVSVPTNAPVSVPAAGDDVYVRNGYIATISSTTTTPGNPVGTVKNDRFSVGFGRTLFTDDGVSVITPTEVGGNGTVNMTGGTLSGSNANGLQLRLGGTGLGGSPTYTGIFNQSGGTVNLIASNQGNNTITVGFQGSTPTPTSQYNLSGGTINVPVGAGNNNGITVRNGTFEMTGGSILGTGISQRFMTISSQAGPSTPGLENVATAKFSAGTVTTGGGVNMATASNTKAFMTISGANLKMDGDFAMGSNATNSYAQVDMSGGSLRVGDYPTDTNTRRLIIGNTAGNSTGQFNLSGGTVTLDYSLVVANNPGTKGTLNMTGGTLYVRSAELTRSGSGYDLTQDTAVISINGPNALFIQEDNPNGIGSGAGQVTIGGVGKARFEVLQGEARVREFVVTNSATSRATLKVAGGKLVVRDALNRNNDASAATIPSIILTGGELELTSPGGIMQWQASMDLNGTKLDTKPNALLQTNLGNSSRPGNFSLNTGSTWDLDIADGTLSGADWVIVNNGLADLNGGLLNINLLGGYTPAIGDTVRILRNATAAGVVTLGGVAVSDPLWQPIVAAGGTEIHLVYGAVPEPSSILLIGIGLAMFSATRRTSRT